MRTLRYVKMLMLKSCFRRISKDFRQKELMPLKLIFFVQSSTLFVLYPYLTIHMRELGINVEETAIMSSITPLVSMVMPPLAGMLADRIGNFRILLSVFSAFGGLAALLLLLVPIGRVTVHFPERIVMDLGCQGGGGPLLHTMSQTHPCETKLESEIAVTVESCGFVCDVKTGNETDRDLVLKSRVYTIKHYNLQTGANITYKYTVAQNDLPANVGQQEDMRENRQLRNNEFFKTSIRQVSKNRYFFPTDQLYQFSCIPSKHVEDFGNFSIDTLHEVYGNRISCTLGHLIKPKNSDRTINYHLYKSKIKSLQLDEEDRQEEQQKYLAEEISWSGEDFRKLTCDNPDSTDTRIVIDTQLDDHDKNLESKRVLNTNECSKRCIVTVPRNAMCSNMNMEIEYNVSLTFWLYLVIRVFIGIIGGTTFAMFEGAVIAILREHEADYGLQRIYGSIGGMISSPLSGLLIDYASRGKSYTDFRPAFYLYAALKLASGFLMLLINLEFKAPSTNVVRDVFTVLRNIETAALFLACFVLGTAWGYIESFLFWLIQDLGGSRSLMGITITVGGIAGIPLLALSGPIISKIGHANVLFIGFVFYAVRLCGYSLIYNPWHTLIFEALESVTSSLSFTAAVTYAAKLSTTSTDSSIQGLLGGVYYGVGKGSGSLIGGYLMKAFGTRPTYQIFAVITLVTGIIYFIFNVAYLKKRPQVEGNDIVKKKPKPTDVKSSEKHTNDINLEEKPQLKEIEKKREDNSVKNDGIDNGGFLKELSTETNEQNSNQIEAIKNAKNVNKTNTTPISQHENKSTRKSDTSHVKNEKSSARENSFTNPNFEADKSDQCEITVESQRVDDKRVD
ncbi:major facilitator superfamily domain-containing protein 6 [Odontomachus brunneus]|uniref:major facilitator superfamily domain-containing protein 6 n=1 Tax=Odontomachus brunneus TaxID=486640 RepID=UPI0013F2AB0A|nr:major facilitator superfamily domain-containing protein 6 [Odontomachus brunneus]